MNNNNKNGILGEAKVLAYFIENGYSVFTPFDGHETFDLVVYKDNILQRVSVKSTTVKEYNTWVVTIGQHTRNIATNKRIHIPFDATSCDILAVYIIPLDKIMIFNAKEIEPKSQLRFKLDGVLNGVDCC